MGVDASAGPSGREVNARVVGQLDSWTERGGRQGAEAAKKWFGSVDNRQEPWRLSGLAALRPHLVACPTVALSNWVGVDLSESRAVLIRLERCAVNRSSESAGADSGVNAREARRGAWAPINRLERLSRPQGSAEPVAFQATERRSSGTRIAESAGMFVKRVGHFMKPTLEARMGLPSGVVVLIALAQGDRVVYKWQHSLDQMTWIELPDTLQAKTTVSGLPENNLVFFRLPCLTKDGLGDFSDVVAFFVR
jgi:hypothetical protein